jgi:hypothetical protein
MQKANMGTTLFPKKEAGALNTLLRQKFLSRAKNEYVQQNK